MRYNSSFGKDSLRLRGNTRLRGIGSSARFARSPSERQLSQNPSCTYNLQSSFGNDSSATGRMPVHIQDDKARGASAQQSPTPGPGEYIGASHSSLNTSGGWLGFCWNDALSRRQEPRNAKRRFLGVHGWRIHSKLVERLVTRDDGNRKDGVTRYTSDSPCAPRTSTSHNNFVFLNTSKHNAHPSDPPDGQDKFGSRRLTSTHTIDNHKLDVDRPTGGT